ncbi:MAG: RES domain-containing protein [Candidatus Dormibacteria bacterium]
MPDFLSERQPPEHIYRVGRAPDPWTWPDWRYIGGDGTFGNRWDDPEGTYRVLYSSNTHLACYLECLARFRPDPRVVAGLAAIQDDQPNLPATAAAGVLPASWARTRQMGRAQITVGVFADVASAESLGVLNQALPFDVIFFGLDELDAAAIRAKAPRALTQRISRYVFRANRAGAGLFAGVYYRSRLGDNLDNFALFEGPDRWELQDRACDPIRVNDPEFKQALHVLGVRLDRR